MKKTKSKKNKKLRRNGPVMKSAESVLTTEAGRESVIGKICERGWFSAGSERVKELWMVRLVSQERKKMS